MYSDPLTHELARAQTRLYLKQIIKARLDSASTTATELVRSVHRRLDAEILALNSQIGALNAKMGRNTGGQLEYSEVTH